MSKPTFKDIEKLFFELIMPFHQIERDLPMPIQNHRNDNDAEHSWSLALLAGCLAPQVDPSLDVGQVCMFAIVHDVVEIYAGDTSVWAPKAQLSQKSASEAAAIKKIQENFLQFPWLASTIETYEHKDTPEARFVWALDKFLNLLALYEDKGYYFLRGKITKERFEKHLATHRQKAHAHAGVAEYYEQLRSLCDQHPEYFYAGGNNG